MKPFKVLIILLSMTLVIGYVDAYTEVLFSPVDKPTKRLLELINASRYRIHAAVYMITDKIIAEALIEAKVKRHVDVQIITDKITYESSYGKGKLLLESGVPLFVYDAKLPTTRFFANGPIMHHKFAIFDEVKVWTGSFNWTASANRCNQENVVITDEQQVCIKFKTQFNQLKALCQTRSVELDKSIKAPSTKKEPLFETSIQMVKAILHVPETV